MRCCRVFHSACEYMTCRMWHFMHVRVRTSRVKFSSCELKYSSSTCSRCPAFMCLRTSVGGDQSKKTETHLSPHSIESNCSNFTSAMDVIMFYKQLRCAFALNINYDVAHNEIKTLNSTTIEFITRCDFHPVP